MIDIVIVNWNSGSLLKNCVDSILASDNIGLLNHVIIIDNHSKDQSLQIVPENDKVYIIQNSVNEGFAKAANQGFRKSTQKYVLLLNPDAALYDNTLSASVRFMESNPDVSVMGCRLINSDGQVAKSCSRFPTPSSFLNDATGLSKIAPQFFKPALIMTDWDHLDSRFVNQVMGAFMLIRREVFEKIGYFDERFFVYFEDLDFSKRLADFGGKSFFNTEIQAFHQGAGTTASVLSYRFYLFVLSKLKYSKKHFSFLGYLVVFFSTFLIEPFTRTLYSLFKGNFSEIGKIWKGYFMVISHP